MANIEGARNRGRITSPRVTEPDRPSAPTREAPEPAPEPLNQADLFEQTNPLDLRRAAAGISLTPPEPPTGVTVRNTVGTSFEMPTATENSLGGQQNINVGSQIRTPGGYGLDYGMTITARSAVALDTHNGISSFEVTADVGLSARVGANTPMVGGSFGHTEGVNATFRVSMPEAMAQLVDPSRINPLDPYSMPTGTTLRLDGSQYDSTALGASLSVLAIDTQVSSAEGLSLEVSRTGRDTVRVTAGPTEAFGERIGIGVNLGIAQARLTGGTQVEGSALRSAEFDLSTPEGAAAYEALFRDGQMPRDNGPGVSGVSQTVTVDATGTAGVSGRIGSLSGSITANTNTVNTVNTIAPDGSSVQEHAIRYGDNVPLTVRESFGADQVLDAEARTYSYAIEVDDNLAKTLNRLVGEERFQGGTTVDYVASEGEMRELREMTEGIRDRVGYPYTELVTDGESVSDFALGLARASTHNSWGFAGQLSSIAELADGQIRNAPVPLPGEFVTRS